MAATKRSTVYMPLDEIAPADRNPKRHDMPAIKASLRDNGFIDQPILDERTSKLLGGHGRIKGLVELRDEGDPAPDGVRVQKGTWLVPIQRGVASRDDRHAEALGIVLNRLTERGGWDPAELTDMLTELDGAGFDVNTIGFNPGEIDDLIAQMEEEMLAFNPEKGHDVKTAAQAEDDMDDRAARYALKGIRSLVLDYQLADFDIVAASCARLRRARGLETNSELIRQLVAEASEGLVEGPAGDDDDLSA